MGKPRTGGQASGVTGQACPLLGGWLLVGRGMTVSQQYGTLVHGAPGPAAPPPRQEATPAPRRVAFGTYLPPELHREFKARCAVLGVGMQDGTEQAIRSWLENHSV